MWMQRENAFLMLAAASSLARLLCKARLQHGLLMLSLDELQTECRQI